MAIRIVLLDLGGVLLDMGNPYGLPQGQPDWRGRQALIEELRRRGAKARLEDLERWVFAPWRQRWEGRAERGREARWEPHLRRLRRATAIRAHGLTILRVWFRPYSEHLRPVAGAPEVVAELRARGLRLGLVSNVPLPGRLYREVLERHGLAAGLDDLRFSYDEGTRKPSPAMIRAALAALGAAPRDAVMVGDRRRSDVAAGRSAGTWTVWLRGEDGGGPAPDRAIGSIAELPAAVAALGRT